MMYCGLAVSSTGSAHKKNKRLCQDRSAFISDRHFSAIVVSDGHGANKHFRSDVGAEIAIEICERELPDFVKAVRSVKSEKQLLSLLKDFEKHIVFCWHEEVDNELIINPLMDDEYLALESSDVEQLEKNPYIAFGATLILVVACSERLFVVQLGDGNCRIIVDQRIESPLLEDDSLKFGRTSSLCSTDAASRIRDAILPLAPINACVISSDGVYNSFDSEINYNVFCAQLVRGFYKQGADFKEALEDFLPSLSADGSGDDVSVAIMCDIIKK